MFSQIVVGTDGSETAQLAVAVASDMAKAHDAVLHFVHAYRTSADEAESVAIVARLVRAAGVDQVGAHSRQGDPAGTILSVAEEFNADLIVVGSKGMRGARRMIGSVPNSVAHRARCHVMVVKTT